jgi:PAS domain S-box-containing protein
MNKNEPEYRIKELELELSNLKSSIIATRESANQKEQALMEINDKFLTIINSIFGFIALINANTLQYEYVNDMYEKALGIPREKIIGSHIKDIIGETNYQFHLKYINEVKSGKSVAYEDTLDDVSGKRWIQAYFSPIIDANGHVASFAVLNFDITDRKQIEQAHKESESSLRNAQEIAKMGSWEWDMVTQKTIWSDNYFAIHGLKSNEVEPTFELFRSRIHPDDVHFLDETHARIMKDKTPSYFELRLIQPDGTVKWIQNNISPVIEDDKLIKLKGVIIDITDRKQAEEALSIQYRISDIFLTAADTEMFNEVLKVILEAMKSPFGIFGYIDEYGACVMPTMTRQIWDECRIPDKTFRFPRETWGDSTWVQALREKRTIYSNEPSINIPEGHAKIQRHISKPILYQGESIGLFVVANKETDYTKEDLQTLEKISNYVAPILHSMLQRNLAEGKLKANETILEKLNADKDRFISILGHDLKSPFNALLGLSELLTENIRKYDIDKIENLVNHINKSAQTTYNLLEDILLWARTQQGKIPFKPQILSFRNICMDILEILKPNTDAKNITINYNPADEINIFADIDMLQTVLRNLVSNAIKFTNKNGVINISAEENSGNVTISVSDNGIGIAPDNLTKLFDIAQVLTTTGTAEEKGTGLGLILCKEFVEKHGGKIWAESKYGKGSEFKFTMPICPGLA